MTEITRVETATAVLPLPAPLQLGAMTVTRREYSAVRASDADGVSGVAYCLSREAPMAEIVDRLVAGHAIGADADDPAATWDRMLRQRHRRARGPGSPGDRPGRHRVMGHRRPPGRRAPVAGRPGTGDAPRDATPWPHTPATRPPREVADEVLAQATGWSQGEISRMPDPAYMRELLALLGAELPAETGLVVDVGFGWRDADEALAEIAQWGDPRLAWS